MRMQSHPASQLFPLMEGADLDAFVADIAAHGLREPIVTHENMILDGRNRLLACEKANVPPSFRVWENSGDPVAYVVSMNLARRHLNES